MQVSLKYCEDYEYNNLKTVIDESVKSLGGWEKYISPGDKVLVKPNLLSKRKPEEAITTNPAFVKALVSLIIENGGSAIIGDSPGGPFTGIMLTGVYRATGMEAVAAETGATLNKNFGSFTAENPEGLLLKKLTLTDMLNDADKVFNVAKLKTHGMMTFTGAVKNTFGLVPGVIKAEYHLNMPDYDNFSDALIDVCLACKPDLSFIDGIVGMEGNGPASGNPVHTGAVLASASPYHLDQVACKLIGLEVDDVPMLRRMAARGMIDKEMLDIEFTGERMSRFQIKPYTPPESMGAMNLTNPKIPSLVRKFIARHIQTRPVFNDNQCNGCAVCKEACPVDIIKIAENKATLDYKDCIRCYCCQELCPRRAITINRPWLSRLLRL
ncbi:MAG: DUF362 domain-containing protein [Defluviitaleaceae bacterium]|nr:DUF362 domain-containing protein [Defluviitaleaceae bacterium]